MSSVINKVKAALSSDHSSSHNNTTSDREGTNGPHQSRGANAADPRVDSDRNGSNAFHNNNNTHTTHTNPTSHLSGTDNSHSNNYTHGGHSDPLSSNRTDGPAPHTSGPHHSDALNKGDPRVDAAGRSLDHRYGATAPDAHNASNTISSGTTGASHSTGITGAGHSTGMTGAGHSTGMTGAGHNTGMTGAGHSTGMTGAGHNTGMTGAGHNTGMTGAGHNTGMTGAGHSTGMTGSHQPYTSGGPEGEHGPHSSRAANVADPRVDSDRDGHKGVKSSTGGVRTAGPRRPHNERRGSSSSSSASSSDGEGGRRPHRSRKANAVDPRVDSDGRNKLSRDSGAYNNNGHSTTTTGTGNDFGSNAQTTNSASSTGPAPKTAGPHKSDILNKIDPRVDSNLDGSKTVGGDKTFEGSEARRY